MWWGGGQGGTTAIVMQPVLLVASFFVPINHRDAGTRADEWREGGRDDRTVESGWSWTTDTGAVARCHWCSWG